jgi:hypothetical protein
MSNSNDKTDDVSKLVDREYAEAWKPDPGDKLIGSVVEISQRDGTFGAYPILTVRQDDGTELALHAFHTVVANELARARPEIGERIAIKYIGMKPGSDGRAGYHAYKVAVDRPEPVFNWGAYADEFAGSPDDAEWRQSEDYDDDAPSF